MSCSTSGYDCISSEMGHLFYTELGNTRPNYDTGCGFSGSSCLANKGVFQNLQSGDWLNPSSDYWSNTQYAVNTDVAFYFNTYYGYQYTGHKHADNYAIAVRPGDVTVVPKPISSILFLTGGALLAGRQYLKKRSKILRRNGC